MENVIIKDVAEVFTKNTNGDVRFLGLTASNDITQSVQNTEIRAGIGNAVVNQLVSDKAIQFTVTTGVHSDSIYEMQSGTTFADGSYTVQKAESLELASGKFTITGTATGTTAIVIDKHGEQLTGTISGSSVTITGGTDGDTYTVIYPSEVTGQILDLRVDTYPENWYVEMHTIAIDLTSNLPVADVYWIFDQAQPDGALKASLKAGTNVNDEITFKALLPVGSKSYGRYIVVPRV